MTHPNTTRTVKDEEVEKAAMEHAEKCDNNPLLAGSRDYHAFIAGAQYAYSHPDTAQLVAFGELVLDMAAKKAKSYCSDLAEVNKDSILSFKSRLQQMAEEFKGGEG